MERLLPFFWAASALAAPPQLAPDFRLSVQPMQEQVEVRAQAPANHHFNLKAPMLLELQQSTAAKVAPVGVTSRELVFRIPRRIPSPFRVSLYLCDNQNRYCQKKTVSREWKPGP